MLDVADRDSVRLADALAQTLATAPCRVVDGFDRRFHAYIEAHIEQGPRLEAEQRSIGVVTGIQGSQRYTVDISGEEAHAGTTPLRVRKDALRSAVAVVQALERHMHDPADVVRFTVGRFECRPGSPNTVPGQVHFTIDFRHPDAAVLNRLGDAIAGVVAASVAPCTATVARITDVPPTVFDPRIVDLVRAKAAALSLPHMDMPSGAGHDAMHVARSGGDDLRALRAWRQPQRSRSRDARRSGGRCARACRLPRGTRQRIGRSSAAPCAALRRHRRGARPAGGW
jgi:N-carbamoyl-L-amino-acid hydrolase